MNFIKKILLIFIGLLISLIILEMFLQITGFALITIKEYKNKKLKDPNIITILCLGESTTDGQWPPILQKILDKKAKLKKFRVIDEGHMAKNSEYLLYEIVEKKLNFYKPDMTICMVGINDNSIPKSVLKSHKNKPFYHKSKTYKLFILIKKHIAGIPSYTLSTKILRYRVPNFIYPDMIDKIFKSGSLVIAMQYPRLDINYLKENLKTSKNYDRIIFLSNESNFNEALKSCKTEDIFKDMFAGSFGHCTQLGNTLIAENVAETILKLYDN